jgi:homoserine O-acetyltransferase
MRAYAFSCLILLNFSISLRAELLVQKQRFETQNFTTFAGKSIQNVAVGWESYGELNSNKTNTVLVTHFFTANSHAAGKYNSSDQNAGYWDAIIGPGKAIDTNKYFVVSVDSLVNINVHDPMVITTGPASIDPSTGKPYGLTFPVITIRDFVNVQKALLESFGIKKLHAVIGPSMGSMQALDWALAYPDWVPRMISVVGSAQADAWSVASLEQWAIPIKLDPNWQQGNYYQSKPPVNGLTASLMFITQQALHPEFFIALGKTPDIQFKTLEAEPLDNILQDHSIVNWLKTRAAQRAKHMDANHLLYLVRANQLFVAGFSRDMKSPLESSLKSIKAKSLFLPSKTDLVLPPNFIQEVHNTLLSLSKPSKLEYLHGASGHFEGVTGILQKADAIREFLEH